MNGNIIILREVTKIFESGESYLKALNRVSLEGFAGEVFFRLWELPAVERRRC